MNNSAAVNNMLRNFEQIDKQQPKVEFVPQVEDFCLMINGKSDGYIYYYTTIVDMVNDGLKLNSNEKFKRMTRMTTTEMQYFLANRKY